MTLVVDASAVTDLLVRSTRGEQVRAFLTKRATEDMATVAHLDAEAFSALARIHCADDLDADEVAALLGRLGELAVTRLPITTTLLNAAWGLRDNVAARDGLYVAAAQALSAGLVTTDDRLARAVPDVAIDLATCRKERSHASLGGERREQSTNAAFSRVKQYLKEGRAWRIETVINAPNDLRVQRRLPNLPELQTKARAVNRRILDVQRAGQGCAIGPTLFKRLRTSGLQRALGGRSATA